jgi:hypothetical protein
MASGLVAGPPDVQAQVSANVPSGAAKDRLNRLTSSTSASLDPNTGPPTAWSSLSASPGPGVSLVEMARPRFDPTGDLEER